MNTMESIGRSLRDTWEDVTEGWQQLWHKTRNALTRFTPEEGMTESDVPAHFDSSRWGLLSAEVEERDDEIRVRLEVPGLEASDLNLEVLDNCLIVSGEKRYSNESFGGDIRVMETAYGRFRREIGLPCAVQDADAKAKYRNGVLDVRLKKTYPSRSSRITIET